MTDNNMRYIIPIGIIGIASGVGGYYLYKYLIKKKETQPETEPAVKRFNPSIDKVLFMREPTPNWYEVKDPRSSLGGISFKDIIRLKLVIKNTGDGSGSIRVRLSAKTFIQYCVGFHSGPYGDLFCDGYKENIVNNVLGDWEEVNLNAGDIREFNYCAKPYTFRMKNTRYTRYTINVDIYANNGNGWKPVYVDQQLFEMHWIGAVTTFTDSTYVLGKC